jgi:predicted transposase/invertase (TIGR01784 family)
MFDNLCKFLVENFSSDFATWLLGEPIALTELSPKELSLEPIRADALILRQSDEIVLHIEFQTQPDGNIPFRMADYRLRVYRRFPHKRMRQVVIYLQKTNSELVQQTTFTHRRNFSPLPSNSPVGTTNGNIFANSWLTSICSFKQHR